MDLGGAAQRLLQGSAAFTGLIAVIIIFLAVFGYLSSGLGGGGRRSSGIGMVLVLLVGALAVAAFLFPSLTQQLMNQFSGVTSR